jgi:large exoprotein involved in heme utilization and adhesion
MYLVNPNGVVIGRDARIDAGSFIATTSRIGDAAFMAGGDLGFSDGTEAGITNLGVIRARAGDAVLVAHRVVNAGEIHAPAGVAALGAGLEIGIGRQVAFRGAYGWQLRDSGNNAAGNSGRLHPSANLSF